VFFEYIGEYVFSLNIYKHTAYIRHNDDDDDDDDLILTGARKLAVKPA